ncbi:MAG: preprotein translocase subunit SecG [Alphaproteobacteria bacterium]|nr:preprotein translocase subunit SecG [Alphaproteobacteria bacterium]
MQTVLLIIHALIGVALIGAVLVQRSEGGALGIGGSGGLVTGRQASSALTKTTGGLATAFMVTSVLLAVLAGVSTRPKSLLDQPVSTELSTPESSREPAVPLSR